MLFRSYGTKLPTDEDQNILDQYLTDNGQTCDASRNGTWDCSSAGTKMKVGGSSGLNIPLAGYRDTGGSFGYRTTHVHFWSSSLTGGSAWRRFLYSGLATVYRAAASKAYGFSVRCLVDPLVYPDFVAGTPIVDERDGQTYGTVQVGTQIWLTENIRYFGSDIPIRNMQQGSDTIPMAYLYGFSYNHAFQTTSAARPTLSALVNLLTYTEQFDNAYWSKQRVVITPDTTTAPDGTLTADTVTGDGTTGGAMSPYRTVTASSNTQYVISVYIKAGTAPWIALYAYDGFTSPVVFFDVVNGTIGTISAGIDSAAISNAGNGWWRCSVVRTTGASSTTLRPQYAQATADGVVATSATLTNYIWGADLRVANAGANLPVYQRVVASGTYNSTGFPKYLKFDGTDDAMVTNSIDFTATNKMTVFTGARKLSDSASGIIAELSADINSNNGSFNVGAAYTVGGADNLSWGVQTKGTGTVAGIAYRTYTSPDSRVFTSLLNNSGVNKNLLLYSEQFDNAVYVFANGTATPNTAIAPDGTTTADTLTQTGTGANLMFMGGHSAVVFAAGNTYTYSYYAKAGTYDKLYILLYGSYFNNNGANIAAVFNLTSGTVNNYGISRASISTVGNGWYRLEATHTATASGSTGSEGQFIRFYEGSVPGSTVYTWGAQIELGSSASEYQFNDGSVNIISRLNGTNVNASSLTGPTTSANYGNYAMYIGARGGTTLPFNGNLYSLIVRGASTIITKVKQTEKYIAKKMNITI